MIRFNRYKDGKRRALTMSYDDGMVYDFQLIEIFNKHGIKGTFHLNGHRYLDMNDQELKEVAEKYKGHEVSCHTISHPHLETRPIQLATWDIVEDKKILEKMCGCSAMQDLVDDDAKIRLCKSFDYLWNI